MKNVISAIADRLDNIWYTFVEPRGGRHTKIGLAPIWLRSWDDLLAPLR